MTINLTDDYTASPRNPAYLMQRAAIARANADDPQAIGWRNLYLRDARNLMRLARERLNQGS